MNVRIPGRAALAALILIHSSSLRSFAATLPIKENVEWQPLVAQINRLIEATDYLGSPFSTDDKHAIETALKESSAEKLQEILDRHCLFAVTINPEIRVKGTPRPPKPQFSMHTRPQFLFKRTT